MSNTTNTTNNTNGTMTVESAIAFLAEQGLPVKNLYVQDPAQQQTQSASVQMPGPAPVINNGITTETLNAALMTFGQNILAQSAKEMGE